MSHRTTILGVIVSALALTALGCSLIGRVVGNAVDDVSGGAVSTIESLQSELATLPAELPELPDILPGESPLGTQVAPAAEGEGTITGTLSYPSERIPPLAIVAFNIQTQVPVATVETADGQSTYSLSVPYGGYYVVAYTLDGLLSAGYSFAVICGLGADCTDHTLLPVVVAPGYNAEQIDPTDWYAPEGSFPAMP